MATVNEDGNCQISTDSQPKVKVKHWKLFTISPVWTSGAEQINIRTRLAEFSQWYLRMTITSPLELFVSNQGAFNVSRVSGRSALINKSCGLTLHLVVEVATAGRNLCTTQMNLKHMKQQQSSLYTAGTETAKSLPKTAFYIAYIQGFVKKKQEGLAVARIARDDGSSSTNRSSDGYD